MQIENIFLKTSKRTRCFGIYKAFEIYKHHKYGTWNSFKTKESKNEVDSISELLKNKNMSP